jgi:hypothetical protein
MARMGAIGRAELVSFFSSDGYDEDLRLEMMNGAAARIAKAEGSSHIWWHFLDADEFPHGPRGLTIEEYLDTLDEFRIVGSRWINHYPGGELHYAEDRSCIRWNSSQDLAAAILSWSQTAAPAPSPRDEC